MPPPDQSPRDYLTVSEAARLIGVSTRTILRYQESGRLPAHRLPSGHRRFRLADVEALIDPAVAS